MSSAAAARIFSRDHLLRGFTPQLRAAFAQATVSAESGRKRWGIVDPRASALYARALVGAALLSATLKGEERAIVQFIGDDEDGVSRLYAEAMAVGEVRASAAGKALLGGVRWDGRLRGTFSVTRILYGAATPVQGIIEARVGDVEGDLAEYFERSEQRSALVRIEADVDATTGCIRYAGGALLEAIAEAGGVGSVQADASPPSSSSMGAIKDRLKRAPPAYTIQDDDTPTRPDFSFGGSYASGVSLSDAAMQLVPAFAGSRVVSAAAPAQERAAGALERVPLDFFCRCSKTRFLTQLVRTLSDVSLDQMLNEAKDGIAAELSCAFCNAKHGVSSQELRGARGAATAANS